MGKLNKKTVLALLDKLSPEAKAVSPIVKQGTEAGERLVAESQLAPSQKIVEKLPSSEEYAQKINSLRRAAGVAGAVGATSLLDQEKAEAGVVKPNQKKLIQKFIKYFQESEKLPLEEAQKKAVRSVQQINEDADILKKDKELEYFKKLDQQYENKSLMGKVDKGPANYPKLIRVNLTFPDGTKHMDWIAGLNEGHAAQQARYNWPAAKEVEVLGSLNNPKYKKAAVIAPIASMNPQEVLMNKPLESIKEAYTAVRKPILDATRKVGEFVSDTVRIPGVLTEEQKQNERDLAGTAAEIALDPTNLFAPGAGAAMGAADLMLYSPEEKPQETPEEIPARIKREQINNLRLK